MQFAKKYVIIGIHYFSLLNYTLDLKVYFVKTS